MPLINLLLGFTMCMFTLSYITGCTWNFSITVFTEKKISLFIYMLWTEFILMSIYIYKIWNYRTVTHPHRTKFEKHDFFDLFNDYKVRIMCVKYLSRCIFWYLIYKEFKSPNLKSSVVKEFVIRAKCVNHWTMEEYDWYRPVGYLGKKSWQVFFIIKKTISYTKD